MEAALVLTLILFFWTAMLTLFSALQIHIELRHAMEQAGEEFAVLAYGMEQLGDADESITGISVAAIHMRILSLVGIERLNSSCIRGGSAGISLLGSTIPDDEGNIDLCMSYRIKIPFVPEYLSSITLNQRMVRRTWLGADNTSRDSAAGGSEEGGVYVAENGMVYHESLSCSHLKLTVLPVSSSSVAAQRNEYGACYHPCERCTNGSGQGMVYITPEGNRYHQDPECGGLKRTYESVAPEDILLPPCSRCGD